VTFEVTGKALPDFREDGYLPNGLFPATEAEVTFRFGTQSGRRQRLVLRLRQWISLARAVSASRLLVDGSFVTSKPEPNDVDSVVLLPQDLGDQIKRGIERGAGNL
jgi:hypothetical protein